MARTTKEEPAFEFNENAFKNPRGTFLHVKASLRERFLAPGIFLTDEFKRIVLPYIPRELPEGGGVMWSLDLKIERTEIEIFTRLGSRSFTPRQFAVLLFAILDHDRRKRKAEAKLLRPEGNFFFVRVPKKGMVVVWVDAEHTFDSFSGCVIDVFEFHSFSDDDPLGFCLSKGDRIFV